MKKIFLAIFILFVTNSVFCQKTTYYNSAGKELKSIKKAASYTVETVDSTKENRFVLRKYNIANQLLSETRFINDMILDGVSKEWYENGQLHLEMTYDNNKLDGKLISYSKTGDTIRYEIYNQGKYNYDDNKKKHDENLIIFHVIEKHPEFVGGDAAFKNYIAEHLKYPEESRKKKIQGRIIIGLVVKENGDVDYVRVDKGLDSYCNDEAVRLVKSFKGWIPGTQKGVKKAVHWYALVDFKL